MPDFNKSESLTKLSIWPVVHLFSYKLTLKQRKCLKHNLTKLIIPPLLNNKHGKQYKE